MTYVFIAGTVGGFCLGVIFSCWFLYDLATAMSTKPRRIRRHPMVWLALVAALCAFACGNAPSQTAPTALAASDGGRFSTLAEIDREPLGSPVANCANDRPIMTQANPRGGTVTFEFRMGHGTSKAELWIFKRRNERGQPPTYALAHKFEVGDGVQPFSATYDTNEITEAGHYYVIVRRLKCGAAVAIGEFSELKEFTLGTPDAGGSSSTCEDEWRQIPGADAEGRCKALRDAAAI